MARKLTQYEFEYMLRELNREAFDTRRLKSVRPMRDRRFQSLLDHLGDFAYEVTDQGIVSYANLAAERITGKPLAHIVGRPFVSLLGAESRRTAASALERTFRGESSECELVLVNGRICHFRNEPLRDDCCHIVGIVGIGRDVTARKKAESSLLELYTELNKRIEGMNVELLAAKRLSKRGAHERRRDEKAALRGEAAQQRKCNGDCHEQVVRGEVVSRRERISLPEEKGKGSVLLVDNPEIATGLTEEVLRKLR